MVFLTGEEDFEDEDCEVAEDVHDVELGVGGGGKAKLMEQTNAEQGDPGLQGSEEGLERVGSLETNEETNNAAVSSEAVDVVDASPVGPADVTPVVMENLDDID